MAVNIPDQFRICQGYGSVRPMPYNLEPFWTAHSDNLFGKYFTQMQLLPIIYGLYSWFMVEATGGYRRYHGKVKRVWHLCIIVYIECLLGFYIHIQSRLLNDTQKIQGVFSVKAI